MGYISKKKLTIFFTSLSILFVHKAVANSLLCDGDQPVYSVNQSSILRKEILASVREEIEKNAERDTQLLIYGLESISHESIGKNDDSGELKEKAFQLWMSLLEKSVWSPLDENRLTQLDLEGVGFLCWRFYVEPSFYLKTLLNSEGFQKVSREFYLNYYIKQNSYLQIEQGFFKQKIEWKALPADQRLNQEQQELALEQGKARLRNFLTTLKSLAGLGSVVGHSIVFSIFGKVISGATYGVKNVWLTQLSRLGFFQRRPMLNSFISSELTWYGMGGVIVASYLFMIKTEKDFEQHVLESEQIVLDPDIHRFSKKMIYLRGIKMAYDDFMTFKSYQNKETLTQSEENEFLKLEKKVDHDFQRYSTKLDFLKALSKEMEESSENIYSNNDRGMQRLLAEYIDLVEQYIRIIN